MFKRLFHSNNSFPAKLLEILAEFSFSMQEGVKFIDVVMKTMVSGNLNTNNCNRYPLPCMSIIMSK